MRGRDIFARRPNQLTAECTVSYSMTQMMAPTIEQEHCLSEPVQKDAPLRLRDRAYFLSIRLLPLLISLFRSLSRYCNMGAFLSIIQQSFPPHPTWAVDDIPDLTGKVAIVTGSFARIEVYVLYAKWEI